MKGEKKEDFELKRRELDYTMYRTYTPDFPHQTTSDQFFTGEQWDAYYELGKNVGNNLIHDLDFKGEDSRLEILKKIQNYIGEKDFGEVKFSFSKANEKVD